MNHPFSPGTVFDGTPRRRATLLASATLHVAVVGVVLYIARDAGSAVLPRTSRALTFVSVLRAPDPVLFVPRPPLRLPPPVTEELKIIETAPPKIETPPVPNRVTSPVESRPVFLEPRRENPITPQPAKPAPPTVIVGAFAANAFSAHTSEPSRLVQGAGFDAPAARAPELKIGSAALGTFAQAAAGRPQPGSDQPNVVADAGFGTAMATAPPAAPGRVLADAGFGAAGKGDAGQRAQAPQAVKTADFDTRVAKPAAPQAPRQPPIDVPLEILSKPTPVYTDEARALKLEGEVLLDVEFTAKGEIRVLRFVRGLGHGLDESAARAAQGIRFKPAQAGGHPIDFRTTVHIVFHLA